MTNEELEKFTAIAGPILETYRANIDYYAGTIYEGFLNHPNTVRGSLGEAIVSADMNSRGYIVEDRSNTGHDRIINGIKTEIKHAIQGKFGIDSHIINHISVNKDWERLIFYGVNRPLTETRRIWFTREDFIANMHTDIFRRQQGGQSLVNDDFMVSNTKRLLEQPWVFDISTF